MIYVLFGMLFFLKGKTYCQWRMLVFSVTSLCFFENVWTSTLLDPYVVLGSKRSPIKVGNMHQIRSAFQPLPPPYDTIRHYPTVG